MWRGVENRRCGAGFLFGWVCYLLLIYTGISGYLIMLLFYFFGFRGLACVYIRGKQPYIAWTESSPEKGSLIHFKFKPSCCAVPS